MSAYHKSLVIVVSAVLTVTSSLPANSAALKCKSDPIVVLSDLTELDLSADIDALPWDVTTVDYTVHVPVGLKAVLVIRTPNWPTTRETFTIVADNAKDRYDTTTVVKTSKGSVGVTAHLLVKLRAAAKSGTAGQSIPVGVSAGSGLLGLGL